MAMLLQDYNSIPGIDATLNLSKDKYNVYTPFFGYFMKHSFVRNTWLPLIIMCFMAHRCLRFPPRHRRLLVPQTEP
jgi:hypothetical protein